MVWTSHVRDRSKEDTTPLSTSAWTLEVPSSIDTSAPLLTIATVHPRGDQRVLRCAQSALNAGFRLHFIWLGEGTPAEHPAVVETLLPPASRTRDRLLSLPRVLRVALSSDASMGHIHDFYFLPFGIAWKILRRIPVVYDVHEYYDILYADRFHARPRVARLIRRIVGSFERRASHGLSAANVVASRMSQKFESPGFPVSVTPNYPLSGRFEPPKYPHAGRQFRAIYTGSLHAQYGMTVLLEVARALQSANSAVRITIIERFSDKASQEQFFSLLNEDNPVRNIDLVAPVPAHELPALLAQHGIGLSPIPPIGQWAQTVPTKLYEYILSGMVVVGTSLPAQEEFCREHGVGRFVPFDPRQIAEAIMEVAGNQALAVEATARALQSSALLSWDSVSEQSLEPLFRSLLE